MDTFDQRRTLSLVLGIVALGLALALGHVNERRASTVIEAPAEARIHATSSG